MTSLRSTHPMSNVGKTLLVLLYGTALFCGHADAECSNNTSILRHRSPRVSTSNNDAVYVRSLHVLNCMYLMRPVTRSGDALRASYRCYIL